jgi:hypothetical protein
VDRLQIGTLECAAVADVAHLGAVEAVPGLVPTVMLNGRHRTISSTSSVRQCIDDILVDDVWTVVSQLLQ